MKFKDRDYSKIEPTPDGFYRLRDDNGGWRYYKKQTCATCGKDVYRGRYDKCDMSFCSIECKNTYRKGVNKTYEVGKVYPVSEGRVRIWTGASWSYRQAFKCEYCGADIYREDSSNRSGLHHYCNKECENMSNDAKGTTILNYKDNINFSYLLGLIATDGCVTYPAEDHPQCGSYQANIILKFDDNIILQKICDMFGGTVGPLETYYEDLNMAQHTYAWRLHRKEFVLFLKDIGITRNKSLTLNIDTYFNSLSEDHQRAFIRGCLDGDGSICINKDNGLVVSFVSGSLSFIKLISDRLQAIADSEKVIGSTTNDTGSLTYSMSFSNKQSIKICDYLFAGVDLKKDLYLQRKYDNYISIKTGTPLSQLPPPEPSSPHPPSIQDPTQRPSIRFKDHLEYSYSKESQMIEYKSICDASGNLKSVSYFNKIAVSYQPHFYEIEKRMWFENKNDLREKLLANRLKYTDKDEYEITDKEILRGFKISAMHIGFTHFNPLLIKYFIEKYKVSSIYDPTMGWGHRLLGANGVRYIGNDMDHRTYTGNVAIAKDFKIPDITLYNNDSASFTPEEDYESVFTCPPYYNVEIYNDKQFKDLGDYINWWKKTIQHSVKPGVKYFAYVINNTYQSLLDEVCKSCGLVLLDDIILDVKISHLTSNGDTKKGEHMMVYLCQ